MGVADQARFKNRLLIAADRCQVREIAYLHLRETAASLQAHPPLTQTVTLSLFKCKIQPKETSK